MEKGSFESMDRSMKEELGKVPRTPIPPKMLQGFSASVERRILDRQASRAARRPWLLRLPVLAPTFAVAALALFFTTHLTPTPAGIRRPVSERVQIASNTASISEEVALLRELGAWTEEDESSLGIEEADLLEAVDLTHATYDTSSKLV